MDFESEPYLPWQMSALSECLCFITISILYTFGCKDPEG